MLYIAIYNNYEKFIFQGDLIFLTWFSGCVKGSHQLLNSAFFNIPVSSSSSCRASAGRTSSAGVHPEDVCGSESRQRQDHLLTLHLRHGYGEHPLRLRRREGHHPAAQPQRVQPGVGCHRRRLLSHFSTEQTHTHTTTTTHSITNGPLCFPASCFCFSSSNLRVFQIFPAFIFCPFCQSLSTFSRRQLVSQALPSFYPSLPPSLPLFPLLDRWEFFQIRFDDRGGVIDTDFSFSFSLNIYTCLKTSERAESIGQYRIYRQRR